MFSRRLVQPLREDDEEVGEVLVEDRGDVEEQRLLVAILELDLIVGLAGRVGVADEPAAE
jgi:hypothetical protein